MFGFSGPTVPQIDADSLLTKIKSKEDFVLLDVRTPQEVEKGKIEGSVNIPVDRVAEEVEKVIPDKSKTIYVYCLSGSRSTAAVDAMIKMGYKNVFSMTSGLLSWRAKNYPETQ